MPVTVLTTRQSPGTVTSDPVSPYDGQAWYNSTQNIEKRASTDYGTATVGLNSTYAGSLQAASATPTPVYDMNFAAGFFNFLGRTLILRVSFNGMVVSPNTNTFTVRLRVNSTTIITYTTPTLTGPANYGVDLEFQLITEATGSSGNVIVTADGLAANVGTSSPDPAPVPLMAINAASADLTSVVAIVADISAGAANAGDNMGAFYAQTTLLI